MQVGYCIPTYKRPYETLRAAYSVARHGSPSSPTHCSVSENGTHPLPDCSKRLKNLSASGLIKLKFSSINKNISPCHNWLASIRSISTPIVKLLYSDDQQLVPLSSESCLHLCSNDKCKAVVSPVVIDFNTHKQQSYILSEKNTAIGSREYTNLILQRPDLVSLSPSAYYFRKSDLLSSLEYCLSIESLQSCHSNGAGIDSLTILTLLSSGDGYIYYDNQGLCQFGAGNDSITMVDIKNGEGKVLNNRKAAHQYLHHVGASKHYSNYETYRRGVSYE